MGEFIGRRVPSLNEVTLPGDYTGPNQIVDGEGNPLHHRIWFLLPTEGSAVPAEIIGGMHGVSDDIWTFTEHEDGSLSIEPSIACGRGSWYGEYWHGYLRPGHRWEWD